MAYVIFARALTRVPEGGTADSNSEGGTADSNPCRAMSGHHNPFSQIVMRS